MFKDVLAFARPRLAYHVKILKKEFNREVRMPSDNLSDLGRYVTTQRAFSVEKKWEDSTWKSFDFQSAPYRVGQAGIMADHETANDKERPESHHQIEQEARHIFDSVMRFCNPTTPDSEKDIGELIKSTYKFQIDPRSRAAFNSYFNQHFKFESGSALRARRALLFMCRFYSAVSTFIEAARRIPSFRKVSFVLVKPLGIVPGSQNGTSRRTVINALTALGISGLQTMTREYFPGAEDAESAINLRFNDIRQKLLHVHAEIQLINDFESRRAESINERRVHPYIGGSKLCCYLCHCFLRHHGFFQYRGCHWKLYPQWIVPGSFISDNAAQTFQECLRRVYVDIVTQIKLILAGKRLPSKECMKPESTIDLSSVATVSSRDSLEMSLRPRISSHLFKGYVSSTQSASLRISPFDLDISAYGPTVFDNAILSFPVSNKPGRISVQQGGQGREMSIEEADTFKDNFERKKLLPNLRRMEIRRRCHWQACKVAPGFRCKACRASYCSRSCQRLDWHRHVFICTVRGRPNLADSLVYLIRESLYCQNTEGESRSRRKQLLNDIDLSEAFGFNDCATLADFNNLFCLYRHWISKRKVSAIRFQEWVRSGKVKRRIKDQISLMKEDTCHCHRWFVTFNGGFKDRPSNMAAYVAHGFVRTLNFIRETDEEDDEIDDKPPSPAERLVFWLYSVLLKDFDNIPDENCPEWLNFGFCFCWNEEWKCKMAHAYLELARRAPIAEIARFWEDNRYQLDCLFLAKGINISQFLKAGISFGRPSHDDLGIYRLMVEVRHFHRGIYCACAQFNGCSCKQFPESRLSPETVMDYGFHLLSPWERWQMVQLYAEIFAAKGFNVREMLAARRSEDGRALQRYVERMVDVRKYHNKYKAGGLFPDLRGKLIRETSVLPQCYCICH
jgi:hypothetical protein